MGDRLTCRQILKLAKLHNYLSLTPEQREQARKDREFEEWAKNITPGWKPSVSDLETTIKR